MADVFSGCGTTLVEAKIHGRLSFGVDINPVADIVARSKIKPFSPTKIENEFENLQKNITINKIVNGFKFNERITYWFGEEEKIKLEALLWNIEQIENKDVRVFFYCAFSNILKNCSIWLQKSIKPTRCFNKIPKEPISEFIRQVKKMLKGNEEFYEILKNSNRLTIFSKIYCQDAKNVKIKSETIDCIITSPPYVTSYEYADVHQLTAYWLRYTKNLNDFRKKFVGSVHKSKSDLNFGSDIAYDIYKSLKEKNAKQASSTAAYFSDMLKVFEEMHRILKPKGRVCIVIGNTKLKGVEILNAEVFVQQLENSNFKVFSIAKREIPSKNLPSTRSKKTGRFTKIGAEDVVIVYPTEYIIVAEKK